MEHTFNFNDGIKVKLTDVGIEELKRQRNELNHEIKLRGGKGLGEYEVKTDEDGYTSFQFWYLMQVFGHMMTLGSEPPFHCDIKIEIPSPK